jgi:aryl-alcohol dehydrogenase-like predicted oxidoreductase
MGLVDKKTTFEILDHFFENGGNFIDTANNYQNEQAETWIGEWMAARKNRDQIVLATKYTMGFTAYKGFDGIIQSNYGGNGTKSLRVSLEASLKKLQTDYVDILYLHWWDFTASIEEIMLSLNDMVRAGKVLYLGISDTPAWIVSKANQYARDHGLRQFVVYQGKWNAAIRDFERDIIPMCQSEGMGLAPWAALGGGNFKSEEAWKAQEGRKTGGPNENERKVSAALEKIAKSKDSLITSVALAYVMHKAPYVFPIVGCRKLEHLKGNIEALSLELSDSDVAEIEAAASFDHGFPLTMLSSFGQSPQGAKGPGDVILTKMSGHFDYVDELKPIKPSKMKD